MVQLETISEEGLKYLAMFIEDAVYNEGRDEEKEHGMYFSHFWATPETCYWLYKFLKEVGSNYSKEFLTERLKNGTNAPENLK